MRRKTTRQGPGVPVRVPVVANSKERYLRFRVMGFATPLLATDRAVPGLKVRDRRNSHDRLSAARLGLPRHLLLERSQDPLSAATLEGHRDALAVEQHIAI